MFFNCINIVAQTQAADQRAMSLQDVNVHDRPSVRTTAAAAADDDDDDNDDDDDDDGGVVTATTIAADQVT